LEEETKNTEKVSEEDIIFRNPEDVNKAISEKRICQEKDLSNLGLTGVSFKG